MPQTTSEFNIRFENHGASSKTVLTGDIWRGEIRPGPSLVMLVLLAVGCPSRALKGPSDTVRWRGNAALMFRTPGAGLQSLLDVNRFVHTRWWHTPKVMAVHPKGGGTPMCDGRSLAPNVGYFTVSLLSYMLIGCTITT